MNPITLFASLLLLCFHLSGTASENKLPVDEIADGVYVHHGIHEDLDQGYHGDIANVGFIIGSKGVAVIDTGGSLKIGKQLRESIRQVTSLPVLYVINTHVHPDHIFGNAAFTKDKPDFVGHTKLGNAMELRKEAYMRSTQSWLGEGFAGSEIVKPTLPVDKTLELDLGGRALRLQAYPVAHTNTDITVLDSKTGTLWTGDLVFAERTPSIDGDIKGWLKVIQDIKSVPATKVVPGHGPVMDGPGATTDVERYLSTLLNDVRNSIKTGGTMEKAMETAAASEKGKWQLFDIVNRRNVNLIYPELEWE